MALPTPMLRSLRFIALLVQLALPSLGVVADANLEREALDDRAHIESPSHDCDERGHPEHCAICQFLRSPVLATADGGIVAGGNTDPRVRPSAFVAPVARQRLLSLPRGPPRLS